MKNFKIHIEETISDTFIVEAETMEDARDIAEEKYKNKEFVISSQESTYQQMMVEDEENGEMSEWIEV